MIATLTKLQKHQFAQALHRGMSGKFEAEHLELVMLWAEVTKHNAELFELVEQGYLDVAGVDEDGMPLFVPSEKGLGSSRRGQLERLRV